MRNNYLTFKDIEKLCEEKTASRIKCKCGHSVTIPNRKNKIICSWCKNYVFRDDKEEFKYRLLNSYKGARKEV